MANAWKPSLGAWIEGTGTRFRVWAPEAKELALVLESPEDSRTLALAKAKDGHFNLWAAGVGAGARYRYLVDGRGPFPDPASRYQPEGVHGPSEVIASTADRRQASSRRDNIARDNLVLYELHVGTFSEEGTFRGAARHLATLKDLGVTAIELMPLGDFPGQRNWGYDGVSLFAPARCYGRPDDLRHLIDQAHALGLAVFLDVVCNHLGPDGNYTGVYSPYYVSKRHHTPWGEAINFDGPHSEPVRHFFIENALYWVHEYHIDGLRLDATHSIHDDSPRHFLAELTARVRASLPEGRLVHLIAEDHRNLAHMVKPEAEDGWGLDAIWADDFHHQLRRLLAGDCEGYYRDYSGTLADLATTINQGWFFTGQHSEHLNEARGTDPAGLPPRAFVVCLQNHDQVGNRAFGERLHHQIDLAAYRAASVLLLCTPATPLLFMGQEWACSSPFRFFTDHTPLLGKMVTEGRRREFRYFSAFSDPQARELIPDPQALQTFEVSRLQWSEREGGPHRGTWELYRALLALRQSEPALRNASADSFKASPFGAGTLILYREGEDGKGLTIVCSLRGGVCYREARSRTVVLTTEEARFCDDPQPPTIELSETGVSIEFKRPGAVILRLS